MIGRKKREKNALRKRKRASGRGALWIVAALFLASGALRVGDYGLAIAKEVTALAGTETEDASADAACETEADIARVLELLKSREEVLEQREADLETRLEVLKAAELQIERNTQALIAAENELKSTLALADGAAEKDLTQLTQVYESMKPKQAIPLFAQMDPQFAAGFLGRMRSEVAGQIMAGLEPQQAYAISVILAGRNSNVPTN